MKIAAIATLVDNENYGNRLQNFALQEMLISVGFDRVVTFYSPPGTFSGDWVGLRVVNFARAHGVRATFSTVAARFASDQLRSQARHGERARLLREFTRQRIAMAGGGSPGEDRIVSEEVIAAIDRFYVGSDQVWNPVFGLPRRLSFLSCAPRGSGFAYAASFGVVDIPGYLHRRYRVGLERLAGISVRESQGADLVRRLSGRRSEVVLDPVLALGREAWSIVSSDARVPAVDYAVVVILGRSCAESVGRALSELQALGLLIVEAIGFEPNAGLDPAPSVEEFVGLIRGACCVVTDSYHASLLAVVFEVPLYVVGRTGLSSRFQTLFDHLGYSGDVPQEPTEFVRITDVQGSRVAERLEILRSRSLEYLKGSRS